MCVHWVPTLSLSMWVIGFTAELCRTQSLLLECGVSTLCSTFFLTTLLTLDYAIFNLVYMVCLWLFIFLPVSVYFYPGEVHCEQPNNSLYTFTGNLIIQHQTLPLSPNQLLLRVWYNLLIIFLIVKRLFAHCIEVLKWGREISVQLCFFS